MEREKRKLEKQGTYLANSYCIGQGSSNKERKNKTTNRQVVRKSEKRLDGHRFTPFISQHNVSMGLHHRMRSAQLMQSLL